MRYLCLGYYDPAARWGAHLGWAVEVRPIERFEIHDEREPQDD